MEKEQEIIRTSLRMNRRLYDMLSEAAETSGLTMHAEIIHRLQGSFAAGHLTPSDFLNIQDLEQENAAKLAAALRKIAKSVEKLGSGEIEYLGDEPDD